MLYQYGSNFTKPGDIVVVCQCYWVCFTSPKPFLQPCYKTSMHIVAKFICTVSLILELDFPKMLQQWTRSLWWEWTPHSCWHWGFLVIGYTKPEVAPTYLLGRPAEAWSHRQNLVAANPFLNDRVSLEGWELTSPAIRLRNEHFGAKGDEGENK